MPSASRSSGSGSSSTITATFSNRSANSSGRPSRAFSTRDSNSSGGMRITAIDYNSAAMSVRLDKWLQVARVFKTRTQATHAVDLNRVRVNGQTVKPHRNLVPGDRVEVEIGDWNRVL